MPKRSEPERDEKRPDVAHTRHLQERLFGTRTLLVFGEITMDVAEATSAQLLALAAENDRPVRMVIHSPGGHVESADTIFDLVRAIPAPVSMIGTGWVASAGALIYSSVPRERRYALPNTRFLLHQPLGGMSGPAADVEIEARQIGLMRKRLIETFAEATGQSEARIEKDSDRNYWLSASEAVEYGLVGRVVSGLGEV
ncbi:MAG: ATP-dependent Clp protease proteolytic subunit [Myxococcales bacterium]|nr:ATP-dependent Clp protease proteolytic subunit [Myxococcales bacterium]